MRDILYGWASHKQESTSGVQHLASLQAILRLSKENRRCAPGGRCSLSFSEQRRDANQSAYSSGGLSEASRLTRSLDARGFGGGS